MHNKSKIFKLFTWEKLISSRNYTIKYIHTVLLFPLDRHQILFAPGHKSRYFIIVFINETKPTL